MQNVKTENEKKLDVRKKKLIEKKKIYA